MATGSKSRQRIASKLSATGGRVIVKFRTRFEDGSTEGYVLDVGPEFFLLLLIDDGVRFNGFQCLRLQDVRRLQVPSKHWGFIESALRARGEEIDEKPEVGLQTLEELLISASGIFPVVAIHREKARPDVCHIGQVIGVTKRKVSLLEIDPDAVWEETATEYRLREITRVDFGGEYEKALVLVGGLPATVPKARVRRSRKG